MACIKKAYNISGVARIWRLGGGKHGERGARAYMRSGVKPPVGSRGKAPGRGFKGTSPPEA
jgi:hypothetical protein